MSMAWFWFIIVIILLFNELRVSLKSAQRERMIGATIDSIVAIVVEAGIKPERAALRFIDNLGASLLYADYEKCMKDLCARNGLSYSADKNGNLIDEETKKELARRLGQMFTKSMKTIEAGR